MPTNPPPVKSAENPDPKKKPNIFRRLSESRLAMMILSVIIAIILWFVISIAVYPTTSRSFSHVPLEITLDGTVAGDAGLSVIGIDVDEISVQLEGNRAQVGNITADDLVATVVLDNVSSAGTKELSIQIESRDGTTFDVKSISPETVNVKFDYIDTYTFTIEPSAPNVTFADGCILDEENYLCTPATIDVTGPQLELDQVAYCVAETDQIETLSASKILTTETLYFYNENGTLVDDTNFTYDLARFSLEIPVLYQKTLDITYQITNAPADFNLNCLGLTLSADQITLAAPSASIDEMQQFNIGSISLRDLDIGYSNDFLVTIPEEYTNVSGLTTVTVSLDDANLAKKDFLLTDIGIINAPASYDFIPLTQQLTVSIVGDADVIDQLDPSDITVNVDLMGFSTQTQIEDGQSFTFNYTPVISCQKYDNVWAVGDYSVYLEGTKGVPVTTDEAD